MNSLVEKLVREVKIDENTAEKVLLAVKDFLDEKLPDPLDKKASKVLEGVDGDKVNNLFGKTKGLFG